MVDWEPETLSVNLVYGEPGKNYHIDEWDDWWWMDEVTLTRVAAVAEPMSMLLLGSGLLGVAGIAIRRRREEDEVDTLPVRDLGGSA